MFPILHRTIHNVRYNSVPAHERRGRGRGAARGCATIEAVIASADFNVVAKASQAEDVRWKLRALGGAQFWHQTAGPDTHEFTDDSQPQSNNQ